MTLKESIAALPEDEVVAVGARSGYFYVGTVGHFREMEGRLSTGLLETLVHQKHRVKEGIQIICRNGVTPMRSDPTRRCEPETMQDYVYRMQGTLLRLQRDLKHLEELTDSIAAFKPLMSRTVRIDAVTPITGLHQLLIDGNEAGPFWTRDEYDTWERTGKKAVRCEEEDEQQETDD